MCELGVAESDTTERLNTNHVRGSALLRLSKRGGPRMWSFAKPLGFCVCVLFFNVFLNRRIIGLQNFVVFCQISTLINHRYAYVPSQPLDLLRGTSRLLLTDYGESFPGLFSFPSSGSGMSE